MQTQIKKFHQLSNHELYNLLRLRVDVFVVEQECPYPELDDNDQAADHIFHLENEQLACYLRVYYPDETRAVIGRVATDQAFRGQGCSRKLMSDTLDFIEKQNEVKVINLQAQEYLIRFYESFGFKKTSDSYLEDGIPHVDMEKLNHQ